MVSWTLPEMLNLSLDSQETSSLLLPSPFLFSPFSSLDTKEGALLLLVSPLLYFINSFYERTDGQTGRGGGGQKRREEKRRPSLYYWKKKGGGGEVFFPPRPSLLETDGADGRSHESGEEEGCQGEKSGHETTPVTSRPSC